MTSNVCPECYASQADIVIWRDLPINPMIKVHRDAYISPVKYFHSSLTHALAAWGIVIEHEDERNE